VPNSYKAESADIVNEQAYSECREARRSVATSDIWTANGDVRIALVVYLSQYLRKLDSTQSLVNSSAVADTAKFS